MAGKPKRAMALKAQHRIMSDPKTWDEIFRVIGAGESTKSGDIDAHAARVSLDARKFLAQRLDPHLWGEKQRVDLTINDVTKQHLEAIRVLGISENVLEHQDFSEKLIES